MRSSRPKANAAACGYGRALDQVPGEPDELGGWSGHLHLVDRFEYRPPGAEPVDEGIDDRRVGAGLGAR